MKKKIFILLLWLISILITPFIGKISINIFNLSPLEKKILLNLRIPRMILSIIGGGNLAVSGYLLQTIFNNPLATPYTLGISAGASLGFLITAVWGISSTSGHLAAFAGGIASVTIAYFISRPLLSRESLILAGIVINVIFSSIILLIYYIAPRGVIIEILHWIMGNITVQPITSLIYISIVSMVIIIILWLFGREIDILSLGREETISLGINYDLIFSSVVVTATLLTSTIVAITGPIGFVGLIVPHLLRNGGFRRAREAIIFNYFAGGIILSLSDALSRVILLSSELPVGIITAIMGGIFLLWIIKKASHNGLA